MYNLFMKKYILWLIELIIWGIVLFSIIFVSAYIYNKNIRENYTYYAFFNDVDGLIKGSPVKIHGYQVGYVSNISIINDDVFVTFIITDKSIKLTDNIAATVAFTGMGGSKSLELFKPESNAKNKNYITIVEPRRINDFYIYQNQIAQNIVTMSRDFMNILNNNNTEYIKKFIKDPNIFKNANDSLNKIQNKETEILNKMEKK